MPAHDPNDRKIAGRIGALALHAQGKTNTAPARQKFNERFLDEVDPDRVLSREERERRAEHARKLYFARLALRSAQARRRKAAA